MKNKTAVTLLILVLTGCSWLPDWMGGEEEAEKKMPGTRISVLEDKSVLAVDKDAEKPAISLPQVKVNDFFQDAGSTPAENLALPEKFAHIEEDSSGDASPREFRITASPIIAGNKVFVLDGDGVLFAHDSASIGKILWHVDLTGGKENFLNGWITYDSGKIFAISASVVTCLSAENGNILWQREVDTPIKPSAIAKNGTLFFITSDNELYAVTEEDGRTLWMHSGIATNVGILGAAAPLVTEKYVIVPYSSGEIFALRPDNGKPVWSDSLTGKKSNSNSSVYALTDIDADPVTDGQFVYAGSNQGVFLAKELDSGRTVWQKEISVLKTPWLAGDYIYLLDTDGQAVAMNKKDGRIRWVAPLAAKDQKPEDKVAWNGPVMAGGRLLISGSDSSLLFLAPDDGKIIKREEIIPNVYLRPAVANATIFLLNDKARLASYR